MCMRAQDLKATVWREKQIETRGHQDMEMKAPGLKTRHPELLPRVELYRVTADVASDLNGWNMVSRTTAEAVNISLHS